MLRVVTRRAFRGRAGEDEQQRLGRAWRRSAMRDDGAVRHERGVERDHRLLARRALARSAAPLAGLGKRRGQRRDLEALGAGGSGQAPARARRRRTRRDAHRARPASPARASISAAVTLAPRRRQPAAAPPSAPRAGRCTSIPRCADAAGRAPRRRRWPPCAPRRRRGRPAAWPPPPRSSAISACSALVFVTATVI